MRVASAIICCVNWVTVAVNFLQVSPGKSEPEEGHRVLIAGATKATMEAAKPFSSLITLTAAAIADFAAVTVVAICANVASEQHTFFAFA